MDAIRARDPATSSRPGTDARQASGPVPCGPLAVRIIVRIGAVRDGRRSAWWYLRSEVNNFEK